MNDASEIIPVLSVREWDRARHFYVEVLGFKEAWSFGDPPNYGGFCSGDDEGPWLHLSVKPKSESLHPGEVYVYVDAVDPLFERIQEAGAEIMFEPGDREYGLRDFMVADPWGNRLSFGEDLDED